MGSYFANLTNEDVIQAEKGMSYSKEEPRVPNNILY